MSSNVYNQSYDGFAQSSVIITQEVTEIHKESLVPKLPLEALRSLSGRIAECRKMIVAFGKQINEAMVAGLNEKNFSMIDFAKLREFAGFAGLYDSVQKTSEFLLNSAERSIEQQMSAKRHVTFAPDTKK